MPSGSSGGRRVSKSSRELWPSTQMRRSAKRLDDDRRDAGVQFHELGDRLPGAAPRHQARPRARPAPGAARRRRSAAVPGRTTAPASASESGGANCGSATRGMSSSSSSMRLELAAHQAQPARQKAVGAAGALVVVAVGERQVIEVVLGGRGQASLPHSRRHRACRWSPASAAARRSAARARVTSDSSASGARQHLPVGRSRRRRAGGGGRHLEGDRGSGGQLGVGQARSHSRSSPASKRTGGQAALRRGRRHRRRSDETPASSPGLMYSVAASAGPAR